MAEELGSVGCNCLRSITVKITESSGKYSRKASSQLNSPVENQNDLELDFKVFFFIDSCC